MHRGRRPLRRTAGRRDERQRFLIYCEGELTEVTYLKGIRRELRASTVAIELGREHGEPYRLVKSAINHQRWAPHRAQDRFEAYDQVWCVFDVEAPQPQPRLDAAVELARRHNVRCAISNPCFELWLLLHFQNRHPTAYLSTADACQRLEACGCGYRRRAKALDYDMLQSRRRQAHGRAVRLDQLQQATPAVRDRNPWTSVHLLVEALFDRAGPGGTGQAS
jgi:hypothetical protein